MLTEVYKVSVTSLRLQLEPGFWVIPVHANPRETNRSLHLEQEAHQGIGYKSFKGGVRSLEKILGLISDHLKC